jgi:hypothetical protein
VPRRLPATPIHTKGGWECIECGPALRSRVAQKPAGSIASTSCVVAGAACVCGGRGWKGGRDEAGAAPRRWCPYRRRRGRGTDRRLRRAIGDSTYHSRVPGSVAATSSAPRPPAPPVDPQSQYADDEGANSSGPIITGPALVSYKSGGDVGSTPTRGICLLDRSFLFPLVPFYLFIYFETRFTHAEG